MPDVARDEMEKTDAAITASLRIVERLKAERRDIQAQIETSRRLSEEGWETIAALEPLLAGVDSKRGAAHTGDGRRETGDGRRETGDGRTETGDGSGMWTGAHYS